MSYVSFEKIALALLIVLAITASGCSQGKNEVQPTPVPAPQATQTPIVTPSPSDTPAQHPSPEIPTFPLPIPAPAPAPTTPKVTSETIVVNGNRENWSLSAQEKKAVQIALNDKSFRLFYELPRIYQNHISASLKWQEKYKNCSPKKRVALKGFVEEIRIVIREVDKNVYEIKATHPLLYGGKRFEWQNTPRRITVDIGKNEVVNSTFYQPYNGLLLRSVFTAEDQLMLGFSEYYFGTRDYKTMADRFTQTFCKMSDEDFR